METTEDKLAGVTIKFTNGFISHKKGRLMTDATKAKIKAESEKLFPKDDKAGNDWYVGELHKRIINFKFFNFDAVPSDEIFKALIAILVIRVQNRRETMSDDDIVALNESGNALEVDLQKEFEKIKRGKTDLEKAQALVNKLSPEDAKIVLESMGK